MIRIQWSTSGWGRVDSNKTISNEEKAIRIKIGRNYKLLDDELLIVYQVCAKLLVVAYIV